jgi:viroplasmin and RNaseH domain-containing protein
MAKWYVVYSGRVPGVYEEWEDCQAQVTNFSGNCYKRVQDKRARGLQVEETRVKEEPDKDLDHGPDLAHRRCRCDLFVHIVV